MLLLQAAPPLPLPSDPPDIHHPSFYEPYLSGRYVLFVPASQLNHFIFFKRNLHFHKNIYFIEALSAAERK
jgi:hypothetical protein